MSSVIASQAARTSHCKFGRLTGTLGNRTGVVRVSLGHSLHALSPPPPGFELATAPLGLAKHDTDIGIGAVLSPRTDMWGAVTSASYECGSTFLAIMWTLIRDLGRGSVADKPRTSRCPIPPIAELQDRATNPGLELPIPDDRATNPG